jgi:glycosyltransferase involved in cell wall biosynthesis
MKVNIICDDEGWIYSKFIAELRTYSKHRILLNSKEQCDVTYYLPYYMANQNIHHPCCAWMSHQEERNKELHDKFISVANNVDVSISHSKKYADLLISQGIKNVVQIAPGIDLHKFSLRPQNRQFKDKLVIGYVGRQYSSSDRKNPKLLDKISKLPFVEFKATGGRVREAELPKFYYSLDIVVSPAVIEGGPMSIQESLAVGVPIVCFAGVGTADEFGTGVIKVPFGNDEVFINFLREFWDKKQYLEYRNIEIMQAMRKQVERLTWEQFAIGHDRVWESLI